MLNSQITHAIARERELEISRRTASAARHAPAHGPGEMTVARRGLRRVFRLHS